MHFQLSLGPMWCVNGRQTVALSLGELWVEPGCEFNVVTGFAIQWSSCGQLQEAMLHCALQSYDRLAQPLLPPRASFWGKGWQVGLQMPPGSPFQLLWQNPPSLSSPCDPLLPSLPKRPLRDVHNATRAASVAEGRPNVPFAPARPRALQLACSASARRRSPLPASLGSATPPSAAHLGGCERRGRGEGREAGLAAGRTRRRARRPRLSRACSLTPAVGRRARWVTLGRREAQPPSPPSLPPGPSGSPPQCACVEARFDYVCPLRAPALAAGWRWEGRRRGGGGGRGAGREVGSQRRMPDPVRNVSDWAAKPEWASGWAGGVKCGEGSGGRNVRAVGSNSLAYMLYGPPTPS